MRQPPRCHQCSCQPYEAFYDPADRPTLLPSQDDPNNLSLQESEFPLDSFEPDDNNSTPVTPVDETPDSDEPSNSPAVTPSDSTLGEDVYAAERILKSRKRHGRLQHLVKWANYPVSQSTWEPEENLLDKRLLENFTITISRIMLLLTILYLFHITAIVHAQEDSAFTDYDLNGKRVTFYSQPLMISRKPKAIVFYGNTKLLNLFIDLRTPSIGQDFKINNTCSKDKAHFFEQLLAQLRTV